MKITIHGARGSSPVSGKEYLRYGGHTPCVSLETPSGLIVLDAGTGISSLSDALCGRNSLPPITILLTHVHLDHILGITAFKPFLTPGAQVTFMADSAVLKDWVTAVKTFAEKPFWPVPLLNSGASVQFKPLPDKSSRMDLYGIRVSWCPVRHPQGCLSYKLSGQDHTLVLATDREPGDPGLDGKFLEFCRGAGTLIHDAQYTPEEFPQRIGWGHSTWEMAARTAAEAGVQKLILTSHDPGRSDEEIDDIVEKTRKIFPNTMAASGNLALDLAGDKTWTNR